MPQGLRGVVPEQQAAARAIAAVVRAAACGRRTPVCPVVVCGPPGCGKTYLTDVAVAWLSRSGSSVTVQTVAAAEWDGTAAACDVFILEDVQHLPARHAEDLCRLIDQRQAQGQGLIVTCGRPLNAQRHWPRRLSSRLSSGLMVAVRPPGVASRRRILRALAGREGRPLPPETLERLARRPGGLRAAIGAWRSGTFDSPLAEAGEEVFAAVLREVCAAFAVERRELLGPGRSRRLVRPRQVAMHLLRQAGWSLPQLARAFRRDHATVLYACRKVAQDRQHDPLLAAVLGELELLLGPATAAGPPEERHCA